MYDAADQCKHVTIAFTGAVVTCPLAPAIACGLSLGTPDATLCNCHSGAAARRHNTKQFSVPHQSNPCSCCWQAPVCAAAAANMWHCQSLQCQAKRSSLGPVDNVTRLQVLHPCTVVGWCSANCPSALHSAALRVAPVSMYASNSYCAVFGSSSLLASSSSVTRLRSSCLNKGSALSLAFKASRAD